MEDRMVPIRRFNHFPIRFLVSFMTLFGAIGGLPTPQYFMPEMLSPSPLAAADYRVLWAEAERLQEAGDYGGAIKILQQTLDLQRDSYFYRALNHIKIGRAYSLWEKYDEAIKHCDEAANLLKGRGAREVRGIVDVPPVLRACLLCKARAYEKKGELEKAVEVHEALAKTGQDQGAEINRIKQAITYRTESEQQKKQALQKGKEAEQQGQYREAFQSYMTALNSGDNFQLVTIEKIIELYYKLDSRPAIPEEARKHAAFASIAVREAKDKSGYNKALLEYATAIRLAPWWADLYVNTALLFEQMGKYKAAFDLLKIYFLAAPNAPDTEQMKTKLYELEFKAQAEK
jgi:tetratricopeptide (TPR) repeat protein